MALRVTRQYVEVLTVVTGGEEIFADADDTIVLSQESVGALLLQAASSTVVLTQDVTSILLSQQNPSNTLTLTQEATGVNFAKQSASSAIALAQDATASGPKPVNASSAIALTQQAYVPRTFTRLVSSALSLTQAARSTAILVNASNAIVLTSAGDTTSKLRDAEDLLELNQTATVVVSKLAKNTLVLTQEALNELRATGVSSLVTLTDKAEVPWSPSNLIELTQEATVERPDFGSRLIRSELSLSQTATAGKAAGLSATTVLTLFQSVSYTRERGSVLCDYTPFIGDTSDPDAPAPPPATLDDPNDPAFTQGIKLQHPVAGPTDTVTLNRSMNLGDIDRLVFDRISRESRGGTLIIFADPQWPRIETLVFTVSAVKRDDALEVLRFVKEHLGQQVGLMTHEGRLWSGVVMNPQDAVIEDRRNSFTISIEFEGERV